MQKITTIGGGTGHFQLLKGLKNYNCEITAICNMADNGGSSGRLRDELGVLPPGDIRQCMVALASEEGSKRIRSLFNYRFPDGHNMGNLIITSLTDIYGSAISGIKEASKMLQIEGDVLPITIDNSTLYAKTLEGKILEGETNISHPINPNVSISELFYKPKAFIYKEAIRKIIESDKLIICPGDLYGSILPNLVVEGAPDSLRESKAMKIYVCNLFTKQGCIRFKASNFLEEIEKYSTIRMDKIIINIKKPSEEIVKKYFSSQNSKLVEDDLGNDPRVIRGKFAKEYLSEKKTILRHSPEKIARTLIELK